ncbi:MAG: ABC transporter permease [Actinomycetota bacterium]|nr:ABC transporter permease [Actinomycetota bacterium]
MKGLILRRLLFMVFVVWGVTLITFFLARVAPGDPARFIAGPHANATALKHVRELYGLDKPLVVQYWRYLGDLVHGDLGTSFVTHRHVVEDMRDFFPATLELALGALVLGSLLGLVIGVVAAMTRGSAIDFVGRLIAIAGLSMPAFWLAMLFQLIFFVQLGWLPFGGRLDTGATPPPDITGLYTIDSLLTGNAGTFMEAIKHLVLPVTTLAFAEIGLMARITRTSVLEVLGEDYVRTARAKGLRRGRILWRHSLRNALMPSVTVLGLELGLLAGGVFLVETIFAWPGIGRYAYDAIRATDYNATLGVTLAVAMVYVVVNLLVDLAYLYLDPRIKYA